MPVGAVGQWVPRHTLDRYVLMNVDFPDCGFPTTRIWGTDFFGGSGGRVTTLLLLGRRPNAHAVAGLLGLRKDWPLRWDPMASLLVFLLPGRSMSDDSRRITFVSAITNGSSGMLASLFVSSSSSEFKETACAGDEPTRGVIV
jgi:hypothetical protein